MITETNFRIFRKFLSNVECSRFPFLIVKDYFVGVVMDQCHTEWGRRVRHGHVCMLIAPIRIYLQSSWKIVTTWNIRSERFVFDK